MEAKEKKKHCVILTVWYPAKENPVSGIFIKRHAEALSDFFRVSVLVPSQTKEAKKNYHIEIEAEGQLFTCLVNYKRSELKKISIFINAFRFIVACTKALKKVREQQGKEDLMIVNNLNVAIPFVFFYQIKNPRFAVIEHFSGVAIGEKKAFGLFPLYKFLAQRACRFIVVSSFLKERIEKKGIRTNFAIVPNVVGFSDEAEINEKRKEKKVKTVLYVGAFREKIKNTSLLLKAVSILASKRNDFRVVLVGTGEDEEKIKKLVRDLKIDSFVEFKGVVKPEKMPEIYQKADMLVITSFVETFSVAAAEALWFGIPVITTKCGGPEDFINEKNGIILNSFSPEELAEKIEMVLNEEKKFDYKLIAKEARELFSKEAVGKKFYEALKPCLKLKKG